MATLAPAVETKTSTAAPRTLVYPATIFLSAFLLFAVQPMIARVILPWFGGTAAVWTTCMLFFQVALLIGYFYADCLVRHLRPRSQMLVHAALLLASLALLPIAPDVSWKPAGSEDPTLRILALLAATVGLPYFLLSTTSPLLQAWYSRAQGGAMPYRFFALGNAASMLALVSYPVAVEPALGTQQQLRWWSAAYVAFTVLCGIAALAGSRFESRAAAVDDLTPPVPPWSLRLLWVLLAACASTLLLAVTNHLSKNVAPIPFLWVLPLGLYLLSFIFCFERDGWYRRDLFTKLLLVAFAALCWGLSKYGETARLPAVIAVFSASLFVCCMVCHGELASLKPHPKHLTSFYLMVAAGGALGGVFVGLVAPYLFNAAYELPIGISVCAFLPVLVLYLQPSVLSARTSRREARWAAIGLGAALLLYLAIQMRAAVGDARLTARNFYGVLRVVDDDATRTLVHGVVNHGEQFRRADLRREPTAYYGRNSGVGLALLNLDRDRPQRVGVIGLGAGVLAAYGRPGDVYRFYEINPLVADLARREFSFLRDSPAQVDVVLGDGRLSLEREPAQQFDLLAVDAFSGDAVPVHILTREALALYFQHLRPGGILALHASTTYLDVASVGALGARSLGKPAWLIESPGDGVRHLAESKWILAGDNAAFFDQPAIRKAAARPALRAGLRLWTDDYSNLLQIVR